MEPHCGRRANHSEDSAYLSDIFEHSIKQGVDYDSLISHFYVEEALSICETARRVQVSKDLVLRTLKRLGVPLRTTAQPLDMIANAPYGWRKESGRLVPHWGQQEVIRKMEAARARGRSLRAIVAELEGAGARTKSGGRWHSHTVGKILKDNPARLRAYRAGSGFERQADRNS
jgi:hypothetical protein